MEVACNSSSGEWREKSGTGGEVAKTDQGQIHVASLVKTVAIDTDIRTTSRTMILIIMNSARSWWRSWWWRTLGAKMPRWTSAGSTWGSTRWPLAAGDLECLLGHHDIFMARVIVMVQILGSSDCGYRRTAKEKSPQISIMKQITSLITQNCLTILTHSNRG